MSKTVPMAIALMALAACSRPAAEDQAKTEPAASAAPAAPKVPPTPTFECAKATSEVEKQICADPLLAALDREVGRLFELAQTGVWAIPERVAQLKVYQQGWVWGRDDCLKKDDPRKCMVESYAVRIQELRQSYSNVRSQDGQGVSKGPFTLQCAGLVEGHAVTFINPDPNFVVLQWAANTIVLPQAPSGSGATYEGPGPDGVYRLGTKGDDALFLRPNQKELTCKIAEVG